MRHASIHAPTSDPKPDPTPRLTRSPLQAIDLVDEAAAKLKMEITSKPLHLDEIDRKVLQLEMERLSLTKAAPADKPAAARLAALDTQLVSYKKEQAELSAQWEAEKEEMSQLQSIKASGVCRVRVCVCV